MKKNKSKISTRSYKSLIIFCSVFAILGVGLLLRSLASTSLRPDLNNDGVVNIYDLGIFLGEYNTADSNSDFNNDGVVNIYDLGIFLSNFGKIASTSCTTTLSPYGNLQAAVDEARAGDTICLPASSSYGGNINLDKSSGTSSDPITITSLDTSHPATIKGRIVTWPGADYFVLTWLNLDGVNSGNLPSITIGSDHISLLHNGITNEHTAICVNDMADPSYGTAHYTTIDHNRIHDCGIVPATNYDHGVYESGYYAQITNNYIYGNADRGIQLRGAQGAIVRNNIVDGNGEGIIFGDLSSSNNTVENNIFSSSVVRFNVESNWAGSPVGTGNTFTNNCVWSTSVGYYGSNQSIQPDISGVTMSGTQFVNPLYINAASHDYRLQSGSPCQGKTPSST